VRNIGGKPESVQVSRGNGTDSDVPLLASTLTNHRPGERVPVLPDGKKIELVLPTPA
jgi:hypothetical protein